MARQQHNIVASLSVKSGLNDLRDKLNIHLNNLRNTVRHNSVKILVKREYLTKYLALEFGVAGGAIPEKAEFIESSAIARSIVIPKGSVWKMRYRTSRGNLPYMKILVPGGCGYKYFVTKSNKHKMRKAGNEPAHGGIGIVRPLRRELQKMLKETVVSILKKRYRGSWAKFTSSDFRLKKDEKLWKVYAPKMNELAEEVLQMIRQATPMQSYLPGRKDQIRRWNANMNEDGEPDYRKLPVGHLRNDGYSVKLLEL